MMFSIFPPAATARCRFCGLCPWTRRARRPAAAPRRAARRARRVRSFLRRARRPAATVARACSLSGVRDQLELLPGHLVEPRAPQSPMHQRRTCTACTFAAPLGDKPVVRNTWCWVLSVSLYRAISLVYSGLEPLPAASRRFPLRPLRPFHRPATNRGFGPPPPACIRPVREPQRAVRYEQSHKNHHPRTCGECQSVICI